MAMTRLPTVESRGRANLHQGAVGAAIDFRDGTIFRAVMKEEVLWDHPSTGVPLIGARIPDWRRAVEAARRCSGALGLGYVGVDIVIDAGRGAQVLECNAYPGLEIQNVNAAGLAGRIAQVEQLRREHDQALRMDNHRQLFAGLPTLDQLGQTLRQASECMAESWTSPALAA